MLETTWNVSVQVERLAVGEVGLVGDVFVGLRLGGRRNGLGVGDEAVVVLQDEVADADVERSLGDQALDGDHHPHVLVACLGFVAFFVVAEADLAGRRT